MIGALFSPNHCFHSCRWSASAEESIEDNREGQDENGETFWYQGAVPLLKANVAYSLYGVKKQSDGIGSKAGLCKSGTFINSFITAASFQVFTDSLTSAGAHGFSQQQGDDGDDSYSFDGCSNMGYGVGCLSGSLVYNSYAQDENGNYICDNNHVAALLDTMED